jgi:hypothetical protein
MFLCAGKYGTEEGLDGRISITTRILAKTIHVFEDKNYFGEDRRIIV